MGEVISLLDHRRVSKVNVSDVLPEDEKASLVGQEVTITLLGLLDRLGDPAPRNIQTSVVTNLVYALSAGLAEHEAGMKTENTLLIDDLAEYLFKKGWLLD